MARNTVRATPATWYRSSSGPSRASSVGPGRRDGGAEGPARLAFSLAEPMATIRAKNRKMAETTARMRTVLRLIGSGLPAADAVGPVQLLAGGVGPPGRAGDHLGGVDDDLAALNGDGEAVQPARGRPLLVLAGLVVLGTVAGALPPLGGGAPRDPAAEVDAALVKGHEAAAGDAAVDALGVVLVVVGHQVEAAVGDVGVAVVGLDVAVDALGRAGLDLAAEALGEAGPQEVDAAGAEPGHGRPEPGQPGRAQERPPAHLWFLGRRPGVGRSHPLRDRHRFPS